MTSIDPGYMKTAIRLAKKAEGMTSPNPLVGAVLVKAHRVVGKGYHKRCGLPHAEVNAIRDAGLKARGADLYVTLEPCDHFGRTPPCTGAIIKAGIKRVIIGIKDPNPVNNGKGMVRLKRAGIKIVTGVLGKEAALINLPYIKYITTGLPYVTLKMAQSLDGKIATSTGNSKWITSEEARAYVQRLRGKVDAVMVGANTVLKDDPSLLCKIPGSKQPMRVIAGGRASIPSSAKIFRSAEKSKVIVAVGPDGKVDLKDLLRNLGKMGLINILVEGGGELAASLVKGGLVDRYLFFVAPKIIGGRSAATSVEGEGVKLVKDAIGIKDMRAVMVGRDVLIEGYA
ncbi:MAG: bifunctional diaminohydroxyphosphoribosylaminopyrimidine deaminase/5-amino-6-(5-phosphoribosylamino)uracil reductase RibD [Candidatus Omnitrophica bacterium]|nr:bifunctional diaminohydroxyphosphoribosylaminopyrimidine deaminase/5-amino-6-(5-phosphoribosylamino)uracil reductase RibD [Candidatus Omnitrophota bacterium]